jgi:hypothetical protein
MKTCLLAVILLSPAFAAAQSGKELQGDCSAALQLLNHENVSGEPEDFIKIGNCLGFVSGVMQAAALGKAGPFKNFCVPADVSPEQVVRMALNRLKSKPQELDLDAATVVLRALNEGFAPDPCIGSPGKQAEGLHWPDPPMKARMRVRIVAIALTEPHTSFFSGHEVLVADTEIADDEWSLIKLVFTHLPYQPRLSESGFDYSVVHEILAWRNTDCDETVVQLTARALPDRHEPLIYSPNVPRVDLDRRRIPLPCYEARAADYIRSSLEPITPPPKPHRPVLQARPDSIPTSSQPVLPADPKPTPTPSGPVLKTRPVPE